MDQSTFEQLRKIVYRESGIVLSDQKKPLLASRIQKRLRVLGLTTPAEYLRIFEVDANGEELVHLIDAISTNTTYFYRESEHFPIFRSLLRERIAAGIPSTKVWCAAASSGEEPYTLAIEASEAIGSGQHHFKLLATDICIDVLRRAVEGRYSREALNKVPEATRKKYFQNTGAHEFEVKSFVREKILYKRLNLIHVPYPLKGPLDIIFCRNVMIYFDVPTRAKIVAEFERLIAPNGYLFLSLSENLMGITHSFERVANSVYRKKESA
jgi:chemotaxis protein methyltransferase CheR